MPDAVATTTRLQILATMVIHFYQKKHFSSGYSTKSVYPETPKREKSY
jgi:hypothetical protein